MPRQTLGEEIGQQCHLTRRKGSKAGTVGVLRNGDPPVRPGSPWFNANYADAAEASGEAKFVDRLPLICHTSLFIIPDRVHANPGTILSCITEFAHFQIGRASCRERV